MGGVNTYSVLGSWCGNSQFIVECFFIISGYFLYHSLIREEAFLTFAVKKILRLWPAFAFALVCGMLFGRLTPLSLMIQTLNLFLLRNIGLSPDYTGINWYVSSLFFSLLFFYGLSRVVKWKEFILLGTVITYLSYVILVTNGFGRQTVMGYINLGFVRGLAGVGMGLLLAVFLDNIRYIRIKGISDKAKRLLATGGECLSLFALFWYFFHPIKYTPFVIIPFFCILFLSFASRTGAFARLLDRPVFSLLGRYSYSVYVMQQVSFFILQRTLWKTSIIPHVWLCLFLSITFAVLVGVVVYHLVERPAGLIRVEYSVSQE